MRLPEPIHESPYIGTASNDVSPATRPAQHALGIQNIDPFELARIPAQGSVAGQTRVSDLYRNLITGSSSPRRKPVASTDTASISIHSDQNVGESLEQLIPSRETSTTTHTGLRSLSLGDSYTPAAAVSPRRSSNTLVPPERNDFGRSPSSSSLRPVVDERDLHTQDTMRRAVWERQLTPQSPPTTLSPQWDRKAESEPDTGMQSQKPVGQRKRLQSEDLGVRDERAPEEVLRDRLHHASFVDEGLE